MNVSDRQEMIIRACDLLLDALTAPASPEELEETKKIIPEIRQEFNETMGISNEITIEQFAESAARQTYAQDLKLTDWLTLVFDPVALKSESKKRLNELK